MLRWSRRCNTCSTGTSLCLRSDREGGRGAGRRSTHLSQAHRSGRLPGACRERVLERIPSTRNVNAPVLAATAHAVRWCIYRDARNATSGICRLLLLVGMGASHACTNITGRGWGRGSRDVAGGLVDGDAASALAQTIHTRRPTRDAHHRTARHTHAKHARLQAQHTHAMHEWLRSHVRRMLP